MPPPVQCVVTGTLQNLTGGKIAQGFVIFELGNIGIGNPVGVTGTSLFPLLRQTVQTAPDGTFTTNLWGNDNINPANTIYNVTYRDSLGNSVGPVQYAIIGAAANLNTLAASSATIPPVLIVTGTGAPIVAALSLLNQVAAIGTTTLYAVPGIGAGMYRLSISVVATGTGTGNVNASVSYNNGSAAKTIAGSVISLAGLGNEAGNVFEFYSAASQNISYSTAYAATGTYALRLRLESMS